MGYWGWRPLVYAVFISVWVVGCTITATEIAPTVAPTDTPQITLTVRVRQARPPTSTPPSPTLTPQRTQSAPQVASRYTVRPGDTLLGIALDFGIDVSRLQIANPDIDPLQLQVGQQISIPFGSDSLYTVSPVAPILLSISTPVCYERATSGLLCLGQVINNDTTPITDIRLYVRLFSADTVTEKHVAVDRPVIWPGESAPYAALFLGEWNTYFSTSAELDTAQPLIINDMDFIPLIAGNERIEQKNARFALSVTLSNPTSETAVSVSLVLTLLNSKGQVAGYRVMRIPDELPPGAEHDVRIEAISQNQDTALTHILSVDAVRK